MLAIKGFAKATNHQVTLSLPLDFADDEEVEVIVLSKKTNALDYDFWSGPEIKQIGKIGLQSISFVNDDEDYSE